MPVNEDIAELQKQVADLQRQTAYLFPLHGLKWSIIEKQRIENEKHRASMRGSFTTDQAHGGKPKGAR